MADIVLFDLDGTLTNPEEGITNSIVYALKHYGIEESPKNCVQFIGPPLAPALEEVYGVPGMEAVLKFREYFEKAGMLENEVYPDTAPVLEALKRRGKYLMVATSKPEPYAKEILRHFDLLKYFDEVHGATFDESLVNKEDIIHMALAPHVDKTAIMVGDRKHDIEGAHKNQIPAIGLLAGFGSREELEEAGADEIVNTMKDILPLV